MLQLCLDRSQWLFLPAILCTACAVWVCGCGESPPNAQQSKSASRQSTKTASDRSPQEQSQKPDTDSDDTKLASIDPPVTSFSAPADDSQQPVENTALAGAPANTVTNAGTPAGNSSEADNRIDTADGEQTVAAARNAADEGAAGKTVPPATDDNTKKPLVAGPSLTAPQIKETVDQSPREPTRERVRADAKNEDGTYGKDHVDPEKQNGPVFENWPKPKVALLFSGGQDGYIEPCGCAGLENQKGGLSRRHQLIKKLIADGWPLTTFDAGGLVSRYGRQQEIKFAVAVEALKTMGYNAVGFGGEDLRLQLTEILSAVTAADGKSSPFVATNVALVSFDANLVPRHKTVTAGSMRFGVLAVIGEEDQRKVNGPDIEFRPAAKAISEVLPELKKERCDKLILLAHTSIKEARDLAQKFPDFDFVVTTGGAEEPPARAEQIGKRTRLIELGHKGMYNVVIGLFDDPKTPLRYQRVPLDARFGESEAMHQMMVAYQEQLKDVGLAGLGLVPPTGPRKHPKGQSFIGSAACGECHTKAFDVWQNTPHAHASESIMKLSPPRHYDPECLSCHVTGWNPQGFFPFASGYLQAKQKHLYGNGCENCHGPGSRHAAAQAGEIDVTDRELKALQASMRVTKEQAKKNLCIQCHDLDNSPKYDWDKYWPQVEHKGKD